ncbi:MAG: hypothetical protein HY898_27765 [Deltaproteobacteria bacterium]|nr:hypothetical protein [Deltaproteobacteria bacterium]
MRARGLLASATVALSLIAIQTEAQAEPMDPALERLVRNPACHQLPTSGGLSNVGAWNQMAGECQPDDVAFKRLVNQYGFALAPLALHSARTTGYGGYEISIEGSYTSMDKDADYLVNGTRGSTDPNTNKASIRNNSPDQFAQVYYAKMRKGFPMGLEIAGLLGYMSHTSFMIIGADVSLSLLEGFRRGVMGVLPDLSVGGGVRTITGTPQMQLTTVGLDVKLSKPFTIADSSVFTPYAGWQMVWIFGDSGLIDTTPSTDPNRQCGYVGPNVPGTPGTPLPNRPYDGQPVCNGGSPLDYNNTFVFDAVRLRRQRLIVGGNYRYEMVFFGVHYITDLLDSSAANNNDRDLKGVPKQYTMAFSVGAMF